MFQNLPDLYVHNVNIKIIDQRIVKFLLLIDWFLPMKNQSSFCTKKFSQLSSFTSVFLVNAKTEKQSTNADIYVTPLCKLPIAGGASLGLYCCCRRYVFIFLICGVLSFNLIYRLSHLNFESNITSNLLLDFICIVNIC